MSKNETEEIETPSSGRTRPEPLRGNRTAPDGSRFPWGVITQVHKVGSYQIVEYREDEVWDSHGMMLFHPYIDGRDTCHDYHSLDAALIGVIAYRADGPNTRADRYICKMLGIPWG